MALGRAHSLDSALVVRTADIRINENVEFRDLLLSEPVLQGLTQAGFVRPSPIQLKAIPVGRCGLDLIVQAKSGTGKTCVFAVIALETIILKCQNVQVLILAPTREIAVQISQVILSIGACINKLKCNAFIGGTPFSKDKFKLQQCHIAVGTPGRIKQLIDEGYLHTESIRLFVLDEADKLISEGFQETINWIYSCLPENKQLLALSATYPESLAQLLTRYMKNPTFVRLNASDPSLLGVKQYYCITPNHHLPQKAFDAKVDILIQVLNGLSFNQCLVFSNFQARAQMLASLLTSHGWPTMFLAGSQAQNQRLLAMASLQQYHCRILVSTDLTARGIDAEYVNLVVNMDVPMEADTYLHRIGRAGRFGTVALAVTIATEGKESEALFRIRNEAHLRMHILPDKIDGAMWKNEELDTVVENVLNNQKDSKDDQKNKDDDHLTEENGFIQEDVLDICVNRDTKICDEHEKMKEKDCDSDEDANIIEIPHEIDDGNNIFEYLTVKTVCEIDENDDMLRMDDNRVASTLMPAVIDSPDVSIVSVESGLQTEGQPAHTVADSTSVINVNSHETEETNVDAHREIEVTQDKLAANTSSECKQFVDIFAEVNIFADEDISDIDETCESKAEKESPEHSSATDKSATNKQPNKVLVCEKEVLSEEILATSNGTTNLTILPNKVPIAQEVCDLNLSLDVHNEDTTELVSEGSSQRSSLTFSPILAEAEFEDESCTSDHTKEQSLELDNDKLLECMKALPPLFSSSEKTDISLMSYNDLLQDLSEFLKTSDLDDGKTADACSEKLTENNGSQKLSETPCEEKMTEKIAIPCCINSYIECVLMNKEKYVLPEAVLKCLNDFLKKPGFIPDSASCIPECSKHEENVNEVHDKELEDLVISDTNVEKTTEPCDNEPKIITELATESTCHEHSIVANQNPLSVDCQTSEITSPSPESFDEGVTGVSTLNPSEIGDYRLPTLDELDKQLVTQGNISIVESYLTNLNKINVDADELKKSSSEHKFKKATSNADDSLTSGTLDNKSSQETVLNAEQSSCQASPDPDSPVTGAKIKVKPIKPNEVSASNESSDNETTSTTTEQSSDSEATTTDSATKVDAAGENPLKNYFNWLNLGRKASAKFEGEATSGNKNKDKSGACHHHHAMGDGWWNPVGLPQPSMPTNCPCFMNQYHFWSMYFRQSMKPCNVCPCCSYWNYQHYKQQSKKPNSKHQCHK